MPSNNKVHITGHKHPDTDSIVSAIAYANLKQAMGIDAIACRLGEVNHETRYILSRFNVPEPIILDDARMRLNEIDIDDAILVDEETTIYEAWQLMSEHKKVICVVDNENRLIGMVTNSNIAAVTMGDTAKSIELLSKTPLEYINNTVKGELVYRPYISRLNGKVSIIAVSEQKLERYELKDRVVIVGNDTEAQLQAIEKDAACLVVVWADKVEDSVIQKAKQKECGIILSGHGTLNTSRYIFYASPLKFIMSTNLVTFDQSEFVEDALIKITKSRFRAYPVVDDKGRVMGMVSRYILLNAKRKQVILVDHNELAQSVEGLLEADLLEVIDHHRIGDIQTNKPINFRNQLVGSTSTIIAMMYRENQIDMSQAMAGILCAAIISDTLNFKSPTTTPLDISVAQSCAELAKVNTEDLARDIFTKGLGLHEKSSIELIETDIKQFQISQYRIMVSQITVYNFQQVDGIRGQLSKVMEHYVKDKRIDLLLVVFTSIEVNGSTMMYAGKEKWIALEAFPGISNITNTLFKDVLSRKKQIIPRLSAIIEGRSS
jgi:manganese-dependent inorganic pyrophosphatase